MSPDGNGPDISRSGNANWSQSFEHAHQEDHDALPPLPESGDEEVFASDTHSSAENFADWDDGSNQAGQFEPEPTSSPLEFLKQP